MKSKRIRKIESERCTEQKNMECKGKVRDFKVDMGCSDRAKKTILACQRQKIE